MDNLFLLIFHAFVYFSAAAVSSHASLPAQVYWHTKLPNTPMPRAIRDLLPSDLAGENKGSSVTVGKDGVHVDAGGGGKPGGAKVDVGEGGVDVNVGSGGGTTVGVGHGGVGVVTGPKGHPVVVRVAPGKNPFDYQYAATADQLDADPTTALFFLEKDLHGGAQMKLRFSHSATRGGRGATFLPRTVAEALPFSSDKLSEILSRFSIDPKSADAEAVKNTIERCEAPAAEGENKVCATSLESMVDLATSKLGKSAKPLVTTETTAAAQTYTLSPAIRATATWQPVISCHYEAYVYAVYFCHETKGTTEAYVVPMRGEDGKTVEAVAVCHMDTSRWNPKHLAFQVLKVEPGSVPICHFLPLDHILWVQAD